MSCCTWAMSPRAWWWKSETPRLDAVSATLGRVVENRSLQSMPLASRSILDLANLTPGVVGAPAGTGSNFVSNGVRNSTTDLLLDGVTVAVHEQGGGATDIKFRPTVELVRNSSSNPTTSA